MPDLVCLLKTNKLDGTGLIDKQINKAGFIQAARLLARLQSFIQFGGNLDIEFWTPKFGQTKPFSKVFRISLKSFQFEIGAALKRILVRLIKNILKLLRNGF